MQEDEKLPDDFTQKVMATIPRSDVPEIETKKQFGYRTLIIIGVATIAVVFLLLNIDFEAILNTTSRSPENNILNYLSMITSVFTIVREGFSGFEVSSITMVAIIALISLYFGDRLFKRFFETQMVVI